MCPSFVNYSVYQGGASSGQVIFRNVQDVDKYITDLLPSTTSGLAAFKDKQMCTGITSPFVIPFLQATWCATLVDVGQRVFGCNRGVQIKQLCKTSSESAVQELTKLWNDQSKCMTMTRSAGDISKFSDAGASTAADCLVDQPASKASGNQPTASATAAASASASPKATSSGQVAGKPGFLSNPTNIWIIVGAVVGILLIAVFAIFYIRRRNGSDTPKKPTNAPSSGAPAENISETLQVIQAYTANLDDELSMSVGDKIVVKNKFDDGWAFGFNVDTKQEGSFPFGCLAPIGSSASENRPFTEYSEFNIEDGYTVRSSLKSFAN